MRNPLDSLLHGFPVGFLIAWRNPDVKLKDGSTSAGKRILIDGQQRVTALMAALMGKEIINKDYETTRIRIAFLPKEHRFEVHNPAIAKDKLWISDVSVIFDSQTSLFNLVKAYCQNNPGIEEQEIFLSLEQLRGITSNQIGLIELASELDIETVTEIFIRVNSEGVPLGQSDFAMSKIAVNETYGGNLLRKAIDYFCHLGVAPEFYGVIQKNDRSFANSDLFSAMAWLRKENGDLYEPSYTDMLRVSFTSEFRRGRLEDLVALLSGRNFGTKQFEEAVVEDSFVRLKTSVLRFMNETHFKRFVMIIRSAGFVDSSMIGSQNALNFAYILYLTLREMKVKDHEIERHVRRWFVMSVLTGRYSGSPETTIDLDVRQIYNQGIDSYADVVIRGELSEAFWTAALPQAMDTSVASSPLFRLFEAAQIKVGDKGFLSKDITVRELIEVKSDVHHVFPRDFLKKQGLQRGQYNQIGNYVVTQSEINIAIGSKEPRSYFGELSEQCRGGKKKYGNITEVAELDANLAMHCIPDGIRDMSIGDYPKFLDERRKLMAKKINTYFEKLSGT